MGERYGQEQPAKVQPPERPSTQPSPPPPPSGRRLGGIIRTTPQPATDLLTPEEHRAVELAAELWGVLCRIVGTGRTRDADLNEAIVHIHALQHTVMSQAAARAYPHRYRLLGGTIAPSTLEE